MFGLPADQAARRRCAGRPPEDSWVRRLRMSTKRTMASTRSASVESSSASTPLRASASRSSASRCGGDAGEALAEARVVRVDHHLLAGLGVAQGEQAEVGQLELQRVEHAHGHHLVALRQLRQRLFPAGLADEVGHHEHGGAALDQAGGRGEQVLQPGRPAFGASPPGPACCAAGAARGGGRCAWG